MLATSLAGAVLAEDEKARRFRGRPQNVGLQFEYLRRLADELPVGAQGEAVGLGL